MKGYVCVVSDILTNVQVMNNKNCDMGRTKDLSCNLDKKPEFQNNINNEIIGEGQREISKRETQIGSKVQIRKKKSTHLDIVLKRLASYGDSQQAEEANKNQYTNSIINEDEEATKKDGAKMVTTRNKSFPFNEQTNKLVLKDAIPAVLVTPNQEVQINHPDGRSLESWDNIPHDNETLFEDHQSLEPFLSCNQDQKISPVEDRTLESLKSNNKDIEIYKVDDKSVEPFDSCNQEVKVTHEDDKSLAYKVPLVDDRQLESLGSKCFDNKKDLIKDDLKNLMKIAIQDLKSSLSIATESKPLSQKQNIECDFKHQEKMHAKEKDNGTIEIGCKHCQKFDKHVQCDLMKKEGKDKQESQTFQCRECKYTATRYTILSQHVKIVHKKEVRYECSACKFKAFHKAAVTFHQKTEHKDVRTRIFGINCALCEDGEMHTNCEFAMPGRFVKRDDEQKKDLKCKLCSFETALLIYLKSHIRLVHSEGADPLLIQNCNHCEFQSLSLQSIQRHVQSLHEHITRYYCTMCEYKSFFSHHVLQHIKSHHKSEEAAVRPITCLICKSATESCKCIGKKETKILKEEYGARGPKALKCPSCEFETNSNPSLNFHKRTQHFNDNWYYCDSCEKKSFSKKRVARHINISHQDVNAKVKHFGCFKCQSNTEHIQCGISPNFKKKSNISSLPPNAQMKRMGCFQCYSNKDHNQCDKNPYTKQEKGNINKPHKLECIEIECAYRTSKLQYLSTHQRLNHSSEAIPKEAILKCNLCEYESNISVVMDRHIQSMHDKLVRFSCSICVKKSFFKPSISAHIENHHKNGKARILVIGCSQCEDKTPHNTCESVSDVRRNNALMTTIKDNAYIYQRRKLNSNSYNCKLCSIVRHSHKDMMIHIKTYHPSEKLFDCDSCQYKCNWLPNLRTHQQAKHSGTKYECELCGWKTAWKPPFFEHKRVVHGIFQKKSKYRNDLEHSEDLCHLCGFKANSKRSMRLHKSSECEMKSNPTSHRMETYKQMESRIQDEGSHCTHCKKLAASPNALAQHKTAVHNMRGRYRDCKHCGFQATSIFHLKTHKYEAHQKME